MRQKTSKTKTSSQDKDKKKILILSADEEQAIGAKKVRDSLSTQNTILLLINLFDHVIDPKFCLPYPMKGQSHSNKPFKHFCQTKPTFVCMDYTMMSQPVITRHLAKNNLDECSP